MYVEAVDLSAVVSEHLHVADGASASVDDRLGEEVEQDEVDGDRHEHHHGHDVAHGFTHLVADLVHVVGSDARRHVAVVEREFVCARVRVEVVDVVAKQAVEVVDGHVEGGVCRVGRLQCNRHFITLSLAAVERGGLRARRRLGLLDEAAAGHDGPVGYGDVGPIGAVRPDAVDRDLLELAAERALDLHGGHRVLLDPRNDLGAVRLRVHHMGILVQVGRQTQVVQEVAVHGSHEVDVGPHAFVCVHEQLEVLLGLSLGIGQELEVRPRPVA